MLNKQTMLSLSVSLFLYNSSCTRYLHCSMCLMYSYLNIVLHCKCVFTIFFSLHFFFAFVLFVEPFKCTSFPLNVLWNWKVDFNFNHIKVIVNSGSDAVQIKRIKHRMEMVWCWLWINYKDNSIFVFQCYYFQNDNIQVTANHCRTIVMQQRNGSKIDNVVAYNGQISLKVQV